MGIDQKTFDLIHKTTDHCRGERCLILGDCTFHTGMTLETFAAACGFASAETIDLYGSPTIRADLQEDIPDTLHGCFGIIIDAGTMFCCFDVSSVWRNVLAMLADKGTVFNLAGLTGYFGRSYYSLHPAVFRDFYRSNGFEITYMGVRAVRATPDWLRRPRDDFTEIGADDVFVTAASEKHLAFDSSFQGNASALPNDATIACVARRTMRHPFKKALPSYYAR